MGIWQKEVHFTGELPTGQSIAAKATVIAGSPITLVQFPPSLAVSRHRKGGSGPAVFLKCEADGIELDVPFAYGDPPDDAILAAASRLNGRIDRVPARGSGSRARRYLLRFDREMTAEELLEVARGLGSGELEAHPSPGWEELRSGRRTVRLDRRGQVLGVEAGPEISPGRDVILALRELGADIAAPPDLLPQRWWGRLLRIQRFASTSSKPR